MAASASPGTTNQSNIATRSSTSPSISAQPSATPTGVNNSEQARYEPSGASKSTDCHENNGLQDSACTPGATDSRVTQDNINQTICVSGYTTTVRPSTSYTNNLKTQQIQSYGYSDTNLSDYEEDHLIPLELGGSPDSPANLWPEPYNITYGARTKDTVENYLHTQVCNGSLNLADAQKEIAQNWESVYNAHYGTPSAKTNITTTNTPVPASNNNGGIPAGATGRCKDGSYTTATHHQGACSHHGGVDIWF